MSNTKDVIIRDPIWNLIKQETDLELEGWPAVDKYSYCGGSKLDTLFLLRKIVTGKNICDIGFGRGNILHALYPYVNKMVGYEPPDAKNAERYTNTPELRWLKSQKKELKLIYEVFDGSTARDEDINHIDVFYCTVGAAQLQTLNFKRLFERYPNAVLIYSFFMTKNDRYFYKNPCPSGLRPMAWADDSLLVDSITYEIGIGPASTVAKCSRTLPDGKSGNLFLSIFDPSNVINKELIEEFEYGIANMSIRGGSY